MIVDIPYGKKVVKLNIRAENLGEVVEPNEVPASNELDVINNAINNPVNAKSLFDFVKNGKRILVIVNDATRPTPTPKVLAAIRQILTAMPTKLVVATGTHRAPTGAEYVQIFGKFYPEFKPSIHVHDARAEADMVYLGKTRRGTEVHLNKLVSEADRIIAIGSVEPHYFAGYTGGRKAFFPGLASYRWVEQNHKLALEARADNLVLEGNPVHEDMMDAVAMLKGKEIFAIMTVLDKEHRVHAATAGDLDVSFLQASKIARSVFAVKIREKTDIVISVARFPLDINLYQSHKAIENGKLALNRDGILILVSPCREGIGDESFAKLLSGCSSPEAALKKAGEEYRFGYHKGARLAAALLCGKIYSVTDLPDATMHRLFMTPWPSLKEAVGQALAEKGRDAKIIVLRDGAMTVPVLD